MPLLLEQRYRILRVVLTDGPITCYLAEDTKVHGARRLIQEMRCTRQEALSVCAGEGGGLPVVTDLLSQGDRQYVVMDWYEGVALDRYQGSCTNELHRQGFKVLAQAARHRLGACLKNLTVTPCGEVRLLYRRSRTSVSTLRPGAPGACLWTLLRGPLSHLFN